MQYKIPITYLVSEAHANAYYSGFAQELYLQW